MGRRCQQLQELSMTNCDMVSDAVLEDIAMGCPLLVSLDISNCRNVTGKSSNTSITVVKRYGIND